MQELFNRIHSDAAALAVSRWHARSVEELEPRHMDSFMHQMRSVDNVIRQCAIGRDTSEKIRFEDEDWYISFAGLIPTEEGTLSVVEMYLDEYTNGGVRGRTTSTHVIIWAIDEHRRASHWALCKVTSEMLVPIADGY